MHFIIGSSLSVSQFLTRCFSFTRLVACSNDPGCDKPSIYHWFNPYSFCFCGARCCSSTCRTQVSGMSSQLALPGFPAVLGQRRDSVLRDHHGNYAATALSNVAGAQVFPLIVFTILPATATRRPFPARQSGARKLSPRQSGISFSWRWRLA